MNSAERARVETLFATAAVVIMAVSGSPLRLRTALLLGALVVGLLVQRAVLLERLVAHVGPDGVRAHLMYLPEDDLVALRRIAEAQGTDAVRAHLADPVPAVFTGETTVAALTGQERAVVTAMVHHPTRASVASALHVSENTVKTHLQRIYRKLGVNSRAGVIERAIELGLLDPAGEQPVVRGRAGLGTEPPGERAFGHVRPAGQPGDLARTLIAGLLLGMSFLHMLPEAAEMLPHTFAFWFLFGFLVLLVLERFWGITPVGALYFGFGDGVRRGALRASFRAVPSRSRSSASNCSHSGTPRPFTSSRACRIAALLRLVCRTDTTSPGFTCASTEVVIAGRLRLTRLRHAFTAMRYSQVKNWLLF